LKQTVEKLSFRSAGRGNLLVGNHTTRCVTLFRCDNGVTERFPAASLKDYGWVGWGALVSVRPDKVV